MSLCTIEMAFTPGLWSTVTDVVRDPIRWTRGISGGGPEDLVARPGSASFTLNNSSQNSAGLIGYYTPGHANCRAGFGAYTPVRIKLDDGTNVRYAWRGELQSILPEAGTHGPLCTACVAFDWMRRFSEFAAVELSLRESVRPDELIQDVIDLMPVPPAIVDLDVGVDTYEFAFDDLGGESPKGTELGQDLMQSERGFLYLRGDTTEGETLRMENRYFRTLSSVVAAFTGSDFKAEPDNPEVPSSLDQVFNDIVTVVYPRRVDAAATTVLIHLDQAIEVAPGSVVEVWADYRDPVQEASYVGGNDMVQPVANTDYTANEAEDGSGADLTSDVTIVASYFGSTVKLEITNAAASAAWIRGTADAGMQCRGRGLYRYKSVSFQAKNLTSIATYGSRPLSGPLQMRYQSSPSIGQGVAAYIANLYGSPGAPTRVRILSEQGGSLLEQAILRDIGDRISLEESIVVSSPVEVFIQEIQQEYYEGILSTWWRVAPADITGVMIWDYSNWDGAVWAYI
jgi:hypothetical protein